MAPKRPRRLVGNLLDHLTGAGDLSGGGEAAVFRDFGLTLDGLRGSAIVKCSAAKI